MRDTNFEVVVKGEKIGFSTRNELFIDRDNLDEAMAHQAALYAWFAVLEEHAREEREVLEAEYKELPYKIDQEIREKVKAKPTEDSIKAMVKTDQRLTILKRKLAKLAHYERLLGVMVSAMNQRKDMLKGLSQSRTNERYMPSADEVDRIKSNLRNR